MERDSWISRAVAKPIFWVLVIAAVVALPLERAFLTKLPPMLPLGGIFPEFALVDQQNRAFRSDDLRGRVWLGAVLSPSTPEGRAMGEKIKKIQHRARHLGASFQIVCITSSPASDSPEDLDAFVRSVHGSPRMWSFLTGQSKEVEGVLHFVSSLTKKSADGAVWLVDPTMRVRAEYDLGAEETVEQVLKDVGLLANRGG
jgi:cytochrome oxidase Cu insertion factor (SCO1/SenC/PrrC family)